MNQTQRLRQTAIADLDRVCPVAHYWLREYDPKADYELVEPLIREPRRYCLTTREYDAANALNALAVYELQSRAIWSAAYPARDAYSNSIDTGTTEQQDLEIAARFEIFRSAALIYAKTIGDAQLIEAFQSKQPIADDEDSGPERDKRIFERCNKLKSAGVKGWQQQVAEEEGRHVSAIKQATSRHIERTGESKSISKPLSFSIISQVRAANKK